MPIKSKARAYVYLTVTVSAWGSLYVVGKFVLGHVPPFTVLFFRYLISGIFLLLFLRRKGVRKIDRRDYKYILLIGGLGYFLSIALQLFGMRYASASVASLINSVNPVFIILLAMPILKEKITAAKVASVAAAVAGVYVIIGGAGGHSELLGILLSIAAVVLWSLTSITVKKITKKYDPLTITTYGMIVAMVCSVPASAAELTLAKSAVSFTPAVVLGLLYMGVVCTALAHMLWNKSLSMIDAGDCALFYPGQPLVSTLLGCVFLGEKLTLSFAAGAVLIVGGVLVSVLASRKESLKAAG